MSTTFHGITSGDAFGKPGPFLLALVASGSTLLDGLVSWWDLDETSGTRVDAVGENDLTDNNTVLYNSGKIGNAASPATLNSEYLNIPGTTSALALPVFTISGWFRSAVEPNQGALIIRGNTPWANLNNYCIYYTGSEIKFLVGTGSGYAQTAGWTPTANVWHHFTATYDGTTLSFDLDNSGSPKTAALAGPCYIADCAFSIGFFHSIGGYFGGDLDLYGIWSRVLTADELTELYNAGAGIKNTFTDNGEGFRQGLKAYWKMEETSGTRANSASQEALLDGLAHYWKMEEESGERADSHGSNNLTDNSTVTSDTGKSGNAAKVVAGNSEYLSGTTIPIPAGDPFTCQYWIYKDTATPANSGFFQNGQNIGTGPSFRVATEGISNDYHISKLSQTDGTAIQSYVADLADDAWSHIVVTYDGTTLQMYRNGSTTGVTNAGAWTPEDINAGQLDIGRTSQGSVYSTGLYDEVAWWTRALSQDEITALYNAGSGTFYDFEDASGVFDLTDNNTVTSTTGKSGNAALMASANSEYLNSTTATDFFSFSTTGFRTMAFWFKLTDLSDNQTIVATTDAATQAGGFYFKKTTTSVLYLRIKDHLNANVNIAWTSGISAGTWYHMVIWYDGDKAHFRIDDTTTRDSASFTRVTGPTALTPTVGATGAGQTLNGAIDELSVWNRQLSSAEITALYNAGAGRFYDFNTL